MNKVINSVLVVGSLVLLGGACYKTIDTNVNVAGNANVVELNTNVSINTNSEVNGNLEVNTNSVSNTNLEVNTNSFPTSDWQTYTNEEYGFSFSYPEDWKSVDLTSEQLSQRYILFLGLGPIEVKEDYLFGIALISSTVEQEVENAQKVSSNTEVLEVEEVQIDGLLGTKVLLQNKTNQLKSEKVIFEHNGLVFVISGSINEGPFDQFLESVNLF